MRRRSWLVMAALPMLALGCGSSTHVGTGQTSATGVAGPATTATTAPPATTASALPQDKGFSVVGMQLKQDAVSGVFSGTVEVENTGQHTHTAAMKFIFKQNGKTVGSATAIANAVAVGKTYTVDLASTDPWNGGPVTYEFMVTNRY